MTMRAAAFEYIRTLVKHRAGIIVETGKEYLAESRLAGLAREAGFREVDGLLDHLRVHPFGELHRRAIESLTTNETSFFRDQRPFDALRADILPRLIARAAGPIVIWCAAASSGQEPYSVAILLREHFPDVPARIIASDLSREMLARTRHGVYSKFEVRRGLSPALQAKYFHPHGLELQIRSELRAMLDVREINLAAAFPALPRIDLLLVRNVLIYFDAPTKQNILERMRAMLAPDGVLMLGGCETTLGVDVAFKRCTSDAKAIWYRCA
ncbi:MAG: protein-glutamate O-methyltransferase CheR [Kofleriaceae bacterium]